MNCPEQSKSVSELQRAGMHVDMSLSLSWLVAQLALSVHSQQLRGRGLPLKRWGSLSSQSVLSGSPSLSLS